MSCKEQKADNMQPGINSSGQRRKDIQTLLSPADIAAPNMVVIEIEDHYGVEKHHKDNAAITGKGQMADGQGRRHRDEKAQANQERINR